MTRPAYDFGTATFFFFQAVGRRPGGALWIAFWQVLLYVGFAALLILSFSPAIALAFDALQTGRQPDAGEIISSVSGGVALVILSPLLMIMAWLAVQTAWVRLLTRNEVAAGIPLRFWGDELRLFVVYVFYAVLSFVLWTVAAAITIAGGAAIAAASGGEPGALGVIAGVLWTIFLIVFGIWVAIRFAPAVGLTIRQRRIRFFGGFAASGGIAGWMFLSYFVLVFVILAIGIVASIFQQVAFLAGAAPVFEMIMELENVGEDDAAVVFKALREVFSQTGVWIALGLVLVINFIADVVITGLWHGVGAYSAVRHDGGFDADPAGSAPSPADPAAQSRPDADSEVEADIGGSPGNPDGTGAPSRA